MGHGEVVGDSEGVGGVQGWEGGTALKTGEDAYCAQAEVGVR